MRRELLFHLLFLGTLLWLGAIRLWYYHSRRRSMGVMALKRHETLNDVRQIGALVACGVIVMHIVNLDLLSWTEFPLPATARWAGTVLASLAVAISGVAVRDELAVARIRRAETFDPPGLMRWIRRIV